MNPFSSPRRAITLVEVIVVAVIVVSLLGFLLVAIPRMRESAQRLECNNHLKEIGIACRLFRDARGFLPASRIADGYATWAVEIAPYLKSKDNPLAGWDFSKTYYDQAAAIREAQVPFFFCPARRSPPQLSSSGDVPRNGQAAERLFPGALGDYACCSGDGSPAHPWQTGKANGTMIVGEVLKKSGASIQDWRGRVDLGALEKGQAQTILLGEKHVKWGDFGRGEAGDGSLYNGDYPASSARVGGPGYPLADGPEAPFHDNFGSYHPGIRQFLLADISVRPLANTISEEILARLTTRQP